MSLLTNTFTVIFHLRKINSHGEKLPVYARITINKKRIEISVKQMMNPYDWNEKAGSVKPITQEYIQFNNYLEQLKGAYFACYREMVLQKKEISTESFRKLYYGIEEDEYTLCILMNYHNVDMKETVSWGTLKNYFTTQKYLEKSLNERRKVKDIKLRNINYQFVTDFEYFLRTNGSKKIRSRGINFKFTRFERGYLIEEELEKLEQKE